MILISQGSIPSSMKIFSDLNSSAASLPSSLGESFQNLYKDTFNASMSSCFSTPMVASLSDSQMSTLRSANILRNDSQGKQINNADQSTIMPNTTNQDLPSFDTNEFQSKLARRDKFRNIVNVLLADLVGSMTQKELQEWLTQCNPSSFALSLRDFLSHSIGGKSLQQQASQPATSAMVNHEWASMQRNEPGTRPELVAWFMNIYNYANFVFAGTSTDLDATQPALGQFLNQVDDFQCQDNISYPCSNEHLSKVQKQT